MVPIRNVVIDVKHSRASRATLLLIQLILLILVVSRSNCGVSLDGADLGERAALRQQATATHSIIVLLQLLLLLEELLGFELFLVVAELSAEFFGVLAQLGLGHELGGDVLAGCVVIDSRPSLPLIPRHPMIQCLQTSSALPLKLPLKPPKRLLLIPIVHHANFILIILILTNHRIIFQDWLRQC